jgi:hypothetical protein
MATDSATRPVRRLRFSTGDEAETEEFIRQIYIGTAPGSWPSATMPGSAR